jgi:hypothetical protein
VSPPVLTRDGAVKRSCRLKGSGRALPPSRSRVRW